MSSDAELAFVARLKDEASTAARALRGTMDNLGGPIAPITGTVKIDAATAAADLGRVEAAGDQAAHGLAESGSKAGTGFLSNLRSALAGTKAVVAGAVKGAAAATAGIGTVAGAAFVSSMHDEVGVDKVVAGLGLDASGPEAKRLGAVAGSLYAGAWGDSLSETSAAVGAVVSSIKGMSTASAGDLEKITSKIMDVSSAFDVDIPRAAQVAGQAVTAGLAKDATQAVDLLSATLSKVPVNVRDDILDAVDEYGPFLAGLGIQGEQAFGMLAASAAKGMYGIDKTGDALKEFTIRSTDMSAASGAAYKTLGVDQAAMTRDLLAGGERASGAFGKIVTGLRGIKDPAKQSQAALALFGTPLEDLSVQELPKFLASLDGSTAGLGKVDGAAARLSATLNDNASTTIESYRRKAELWAKSLTQGEGSAHLAAAAVASLGGSMLGAIGPVTGIIGALYAKRTATAAAAAADTAAQAGMVKTAAVAVASGVRTVASWIAQAATAAASAAVIAASWLLAYAPIIIVVALIAGAVYMIIKHWDTIKRATAAAWGWIKAKIVAVVGAIKAVLSAYFAAIKFLIFAYLNAYKAVFSAVWGAIVGVVKTYIRAVLAVVRGLGAVVGFVRGVFARAKDGAAAMLGNLVGLVRGIPGRILGALGNVGGMLLSAGRNIVGGLIEGIRRMRSAVVSALLAILPGPLKKFAGALGIHSPSTVFAGFGENIGQGLVLGIRGETGAVTAAAAKLAASAAKAATPSLSDPNLARFTNALSPASLSVTGSSDAVVTIRHEVVSPDGSLDNLNARQIADLIARDPRSAEVLERALRTRRDRAATTTLGGMR